MSSFLYHDLCPGEIRLLEPIFGREGFDYHFDVLHVQREQAPPYTALSYTWEPTDPKQYIHINGQPFLVGINLWVCLKALALHAKQASRHYIWIDALCINQSNLREKTAQVALMDGIYTNAASVSAYLGPSPVSSASGSGNELAHRSFDWEHSILELCKRPYWYRTWITQEFMLGRDVELFCGENWIPWEEFMDMFCQKTGFDSRMAIYDRNYDQQGIPDRSSYGALSLLQQRKYDQRMFPRDLYTLLRDHGHKECRNSRDRVFAILGLVEESERRSLAAYL